MYKILIAKEAAEKAMLAENARTHHLLQKAEKFIAGLIIILGFQLLDIKTLLASPSPWAKITCYLSLAVLGMALLFAFASLGKKGYASYPRGNKLWDNIKPESVSEDLAEEAFVQMLLKTREQNALLNDAMTRSNFWSGWLFFLGLLLVAGSQLLDAIMNAFG
jgi:hypothetical protein